MPNEPARYSRVELAIRANQWVNSDGSVSPGSMPSVLSFDDSDIPVHTVHDLINRLVPEPTFVNCLYGCKCIIAHMVVGKQIGIDFSPFYRGEEGMYSKVAEGVATVGIEKMCELAVELFNELYLAP